MRVGLGLGIICESWVEVWYRMGRIRNVLVIYILSPDPLQLFSSASRNINPLRLFNNCGSGRLDREELAEEARCGGIV